MVSEKVDNARQYLVDVTLPVQEKALSILTLFREKLLRNSLQTEAQMQAFLSTNKTLWIGISIVFTLSLLFISIFTLKRLRQLTLVQANFQQTLEEKVKQRTLELHLDSSVLHNIHEAVAIANCSGKLVKTNQQFDQLLSAINIESDNAWEIIQNILQDVSTDSIQAIVSEKGFARNEGVVKIKNRKNYYFVDVFCLDDEKLDQRYISVLLTDVTELKTTRLHLEQLANFDPVTQISNRHYFQNHLNQCIKNQSIRQFNLFYIDLDNFKWINDTLGHVAGDRFLHQIAKLFYRGCSSIG
jgi:predicted signal transduction protein with EAL and GGDEF domain